MKKNIIKIAICIVLTIIIGIVGIGAVSDNGRLYPTMEVADLSNSIEKYEINKEEFETGAFSESITYIGEYMVKINSNQKGHPSNGSIFSTYCTLKEKNVDINLDYFFYTKSVEKDVVNYLSFDKIKINKKEYRYSINTASNYITLYYKNNESSYMKIVLKSGFVYDELGTKLGLMRMDKSILDSKDIKNEISFEIKKIEEE